MINKKSISIFVATFLIIGFFFVALPEKGEAQVQTLLCCSNGVICIDNAENPGAKIPCPKMGELVEGALCAENNECVIQRNVPTLSEWGLIAMAGILGIIGFIVIRRRKVTA